MKDNEVSDHHDERFGLKETFLSWDFAVGAAAAVGGGYVSYWHPDALSDLPGVLSQFAAVVVGTAIAGVAIQAALMSDDFLRLIRQISKEPTHYLRHWVLSVVLGVLAALATGVMAALPDTAPTWLRVTTACTACGFSGWVLVSIVSAVVSLKAFVLLRADAAEVNGQIPKIGGDAERRGA